jgi:NDP-sugar pyrophosphorylase family protein
MILVAGLGTRLRPLSLLRPKPVVPVRGIPLLAYALELVAAHGVREVMLNLHHLAEVVRETAERWAPPGLSLHFSHEDRILGTGGGIRRAAAFLRESDPCLILGGDMILDADLGALAALHREREAGVTMLLRSGDRRADAFGTIGVDAEGCVRRVGRRFDLGGETRAGLNAWATWVAARAFDTLPDRDVFNHLDDWWMPRLAAGARDIRGEVLEAERFVWEPVGTLPEYLEANLSPHRLRYLDADARAARGGTRFEGDCVIGAGAEIGAGAVLRHAVVWDAERVPAGLRAERGVFAGGHFHPCAGVGEAA